MKVILDRFLRWLHPARYSETAKCPQCGDVRCKSRMVYMGGYGYFCNEEEAEKYWEWWNE